MMKLNYTFINENKKWEKEIEKIWQAKSGKINQREIKNDVIRYWNTEEIFWNEEENISRLEVSWIQRMHFNN